MLDLFSGAIGAAVASAVTFILEEIRHRLKAKGQRKQAAMDALKSGEDEVTIWIKDADKGHGGIGDRGLADHAKGLSEFLSRFVVKHDDIIENQISGYRHSLDAELAMVVQLRPTSIHMPATDDFWASVKLSRSRAVTLRDALKNWREEIESKGLPESKS